MLILLRKPENILSSAARLLCAFCVWFSTFESEGLHVNCWPFPGLLKYRTFKMLNSE